MGRLVALASNRSLVVVFLVKVDHFFMGRGARQRMNYCWEIVSGHHAAKSDRERANGDRGLYRLLRISVPNAEC